MCSRCGAETGTAVPACSSLGQRVSWSSESTRRSTGPSTTTPAARWSRPRRGQPPASLPNDGRRVQAGSPGHGTRTGKPGGLAAATVNGHPASHKMATPAALQRPETRGRHPWRATPHLPTSSCPRHPHPRVRQQRTSTLLRKPSARPEPQTQRRLWHQRCARGTTPPRHREDDCSPRRDHQCATRPTRPNYASSSTSRWSSHICVPSSMAFA